VLSSYPLLCNDALHHLGDKASHKDLQLPSAHVSETDDSCAEYPYYILCMDILIKTPKPNVVVHQPGIAALPAHVWNSSDIQLCIIQRRLWLKDKP
jgi:hypothetical protein